MPGFQFTLRLIGMAIELAKRVGFRGAAEAMQIMFAGLGMKTKVFSTFRIASESPLSCPEIVRNTYVVTPNRLRASS